MHDISLNECNLCEFMVILANLGIEKVEVVVSMEELGIEHWIWACVLVSRFNEI